MKNIEITEENKGIYQELLDAKNGAIPVKRPFLFALGFLSITAGVVGGMIGLACLIDIISKLVSPIITTVITFGAMCSIPCLGYYFTSKLPRKIGLKNFKKKYPEFDTDINLEELKKKLKDYDSEKIVSLSKINETTEEEKHLSFYQEDFKNMTNEEKLSFLEQEKEFWSNFNNIEKEEAIQKKKEY